MTVCIAALCDGGSGVVLVADRMITSGLAIQFEHPLTRKITTLSGNCLALTAGNALAHTELFNDVKRATGNRRFTAVADFVEVIKGSYQELRQKQIVERVLRPRALSSFEEFYHTVARLPDPLIFNIASKIEEFDYGLEILVGGVTFNEAHIYGVVDPGTSQCFDSIGFHVIGSGMNLALSCLIASKCHAELSTAEVLMRALDAKLTAENAPGVGRQTDVSVISPDGVWSSQNGQMKTLKRMCRNWKNGDMEVPAGIEDMLAGVGGPEKTDVPPGPKPIIMPKKDQREQVHDSREDTGAAREIESNGVIASDEATPEDGDGEIEARGTSPSLQDGEDSE